MPKKAKSKAKSKAKLNIKKSKTGRRAAPPKRRKVAVSIPALEAAATKAADFAAKHEAAAAESKGAAEQCRFDADAARQEVAKLEAAAKKQSAMSPGVRLRSRRQTTGPQSSTRLLKRPGERPRVAKPQPSEQGLPPRRKPGAKLRSRRSARQQRRRGSKPSSERSVNLPRRRSATLREKPSARRRGRQSAKPLRKRRSRLPNARNARRRRRRSVKPPARSSAKRPRRQSEKLPGSRRWRLPHRQNAKLRRRSRPSARRLNEQNARPPNR